MRTAAFALTTCLAFAGVAHAQAEAGSAKEVTDCVSANVPEKSSVQEIEMLATDRLGGTRTLDAKIYWKTSDGKDSKSLIEVEGPADLRGSKYLVLEDEDSEEMWTYLPEYKKTRRIRSEAMAGSLFGTDFTYEDFLHFQRAAGSAESERLPDSEFDGGNVWVVKSVPDEEGTQYSHLVSYVDPEKCIVLKLEFYDLKEKLVKVLTVDRDAVKREASVWVPRTVRLESLENGTQTEVVVSSIEVDGDVPDRLFTLGQLERGR